MRSRGRKPKRRGPPWGNSRKEVTPTGGAVKDKLSIWTAWLRLRCPFMLACKMLLEQFLHFLRGRGTPQANGVVMNVHPLMALAIYLTWTTASTGRRVGLCMSAATMTTATVSRWTMESLVYASRVSAIRFSAAGLSLPCFPLTGNWKPPYSTGQN